MEPPTQRLRDFLTQGASAQAIPWVILVLGLAVSAVVFIQLPGTRDRVPVLGGSVLVTVLVAGLFWSVTRSEAEARRRVEAATRDLREAQRVAQVGSWEWNIPPDTVTWSDETYRLLGHEPGDPEDPTVEDWLEAVHPEDREEARAEIDRAVTEGEFPTFEHRVQHPDGTVRWLESRGEVVLEDGEPVRMRGTVLDITDRVLPLRRFESLVETSPDAIIQANEDGDIIGWNEAAEAMFGYSEEEAVGEPLTTIMPEDLRQAHRTGFQRYLETGEARVIGETVELEGLRREGVVFPVELSLDTYAVGETRYFSGIVRDVTGRKLLEDELRAAKEEAEAADRAKSRFLATMSHEIRTPLNSILGLTEILRDSDLDGEQRRHLETVQASGKHLLTLIDDILDFSKIEAGELALEERPFDLRGTVEEALQMVAPQAGAKDLELAYRYGEDVPEAIRGDAQRVRQVLVNLLSNGVKFTDEGEVVVRVEALDGGAGPGEEVPLRFEVEDTGIGVEEDDIEDLFDPFTQAEASPDREQKGTGLGLAISTQLVDLMGGTMEAEGTPGEGSTFRFVVPAEPAEPPETRRWKSRPVTLEGARLLVVDDNETSREIVAELAHRWGMGSVVAGSGDEALELVGGGAEVDVAVLDYSMPGMTGVELAGELRSDLGLEDLPVVVLTSKPEAEGDVRDAGVDVVSVLVKPVKPSTLFDALRAAHGERQPIEGEGEGGFDESLGERLDLEVLVVEDDPVNREVVRQMLERLGFDPDAAEDGEAAVHRVAEGDYDVVFMDIQMPGMDGHEATRRVREDLADDEQPRIVALTAHAGVEDRERALEAGMDDYLSKPVEKAGLVDALERSVTPVGEGGADRGGA